MLFEGNEGWERIPVTGQKKRKALRRSRRFDFSVLNPTYTTYPVPWCLPPAIEAGDLCFDAAAFYVVRVLTGVRVRAASMGGQNRISEDSDLAWKNSRSM